MADNRIICGICGEAMNLSDRQPVALPGCGHTFCRLCLTRVNNVYEEIRCPACRHLHVGPQPEELPANYALLALLEPNRENGSKNNTSNEAAPSAYLNLECHDCPKEKPRHPSNNSSGRGSPRTRNPNRDKTLKALKWVGVGAAAAVGSVALVAAAPVALTAVGFTAAGIAKGSMAAGMMSAAAIANGGGVAAGSMVAVLQSAGAAGIGSTATAALGATGAGVGGGLAYGISKLFRRLRGRSGDNENGSTDNNDNDGNDGGERREKKSSKEYDRGEQRANYGKENKRAKSEDGESDKSEGETDETDEEDASKGCCGNSDNCTMDDEDLSLVRKLIDDAVDKNLND